jgi:hypothetical protein
MSKARTPPFGIVLVGVLAGLAGSRAMPASPPAARARVQAPPPGDRPLPKLAPFLAAVRRNLRDPQLVLKEYRYRQRVTERQPSDDGGTKVTVEVYDVWPNVGSAGGHSVLIEKNGRLLPAADPARLEAEQMKSLQASIDARARESPSDRRKRLEREAAARREDQAMIEDMFRIYEFRLVGRDTLDGIPVIVVAFDGRRDAPAQTSAGKIMRKTTGRAWVSEADDEIVRVEMEARDTLTYGLGFLARVRKGARLVYQQQRTGEGDWVPASYHLVAHVVIMLIKPMDVDRQVDYYDFHRFTLPAADRK